MAEPDVVLYPDSRKIAVYAGVAPGGSKAQRTFEYVGRLDSPVGYWADDIQIDPSCEGKR